jgi:hypothetical protein
MSQLDSKLQLLCLLQRLLDVFQKVINVIQKVTTSQLDSSLQSLPGRGWLGDRPAECACAEGAQEDACCQPDLLLLLLPLLLSMRLGLLPAMQQAAEVPQGRSGRLVC